jgi:hypothetical protein
MGSEDPGFRRDDRGITRTVVIPAKAGILLGSEDEREDNGLVTQANPPG